MNFSAPTVLQARPVWTDDISSARSFRASKGVDNEIKLGSDYIVGNGSSRSGLTAQQQIERDEVRDHQ
jgi:hypothetical protein